MFAALRPCRRQWLALALRADLQAAHPGLQFQKLQLRGVELLAAGAVLLDPLQPQLRFQGEDLHLGPGKFVLELNVPLGFGYRSGREAAHAR